ncbi:uncharacterized protein LOC133723024 [Rosa rugosa]|uniref:uncharacterized protein LOC133723024 n=1 Tax=Rosa rugosa TaxID=74645 RepID=UPI002B40FEEA|nr:uncharacterized protein LOC133723024 [Rosa rugosa]
MGRLCRLTDIRLGEPYRLKVLARPRLPLFGSLLVDTSSDSQSKPQISEIDKPSLKSEISLSLSQSLPHPSLSCLSLSLSLSSLTLQFLLKSKQEHDPWAFGCSIFRHSRCYSSRFRRRRLGASPSLRCGILEKACFFGFSGSDLSSPGDLDENKGDCQADLIEIGSWRNWDSGVRIRPRRGRLKSPIDHNGVFKSQRSGHGDLVGFVWDSLMVEAARHYASTESKAEPGGVQCPAGSVRRLTTAAMEW